MAVASGFEGASLPSHSPAIQGIGSTLLGLWFSDRVFSRSSRYLLLHVNRVNETGVCAPGFTEAILYLLFTLSSTYVDSAAKPGLPACPSRGVRRALSVDSVTSSPGTKVSAAQASMLERRK